MQDVRLAPQVQLSVIPWRPVAGVQRDPLYSGSSPTRVVAVVVAGLAQLGWPRTLFAVFVSAPLAWWLWRGRPAYVAA